MLITGRWLLTLFLTLPGHEEPLQITNVYLTAEDCASAGLFFVIEEDSPYHAFSCTLLPLGALP